MSNFKAPFQGIYTTIFARTISTGLYFPLLDILAPRFSNTFSIQNNSLLLAFLVGNTAGKNTILLVFCKVFFLGVISGTTTNFLNVIKYRSQGCDNGQFLSTAHKMWKHGGYRPFFNGMIATMLRDIAFGGSFSVIREILRKDENQKYQFCIDLVAGCIATVVSSPFNYCRNVKYQAPPDKQPESIGRLLYELWNDARKDHYPFRFIQNRLRLGWGTARVAIAMAFAAFLYELFKIKFDIHNNSFENFHKKFKQ